MGYEDFSGFFEWLPQALATFGLILVVSGALGAILAYLISIVRYGPTEAFYKLWEGIFQAVPDFLSTSPRRVGAIARLAIQETLRRRVLLVVFIIFALSLLLGGWFLDSSSDHPERTYLGFVLGGTQFLVLFLGLLISTASLPADIQNKTIYTVVTKPIRASEIIMGRIVGFMVIGTVLIGLMGIVSYLFVLRGLSHQHAVDVSEFTAVNPDSTDTLTGRRASVNAYYEALTTLNSGHRHPVEIVLAGFKTNAEVNEENAAEDSTQETPANSSANRGIASATFLIKVQDNNGHAHDWRGNNGEHEVTRDGLKYTIFQSRVANDNLDVFARTLSVFESTRYEVGVRIEVVEGLYPDIPSLLDQASLGEILTEAGIELLTSQPTEMLQARVPFYARELVFLDREGNSTASEGMSVGKMNEKFGYIDGGTSLSRAIFQFRNITPDKFEGQDQIPLDLNLRVFRTLKGDIIHRVTGSLFFRVTREIDGRELVLETTPIVFESQEYSVQTLMINRTVEANWNDDQGNPQKQDMDLLNDFANDGQLQIVLKCNEGGQYFGVSPASVYFKLRESSFAANFFKCFAGLWLQLLLVTSLGVTLSSFLNASVSLMATIVSLLFGFFSDFVRDLANQQIEGGGPLEATYRLLTQMNLTSDIENQFRFLSYIDVVLVEVMRVMTYIIPDFTQLNTQTPLADGYNIPGGLLGAHVMVTLAFSLSLCVVGYFSLKTREIAG